MGFWDKDKVATTESGVTIRSVREDRPEFKREYSASLDNGRSIKVTIRTNYGNGRSKDGELTQANGRWVLFDPDNIADKILDPVLVPLVQKRVNEIYRLDRDFMHNNPGEFVDESGATWRRV